MDNCGDKDLDEKASEKIRNSLQRGKNRDVISKYFEGTEQEKDTHSYFYSKVGHKVKCPEC